ncbi:MAG: hypothetical protein Tsb0020_31150 [Haliangiales bacterium]
MARDKGKLKQALKGYIELEQIEPDDGEWSRRAAEMYRRLGQDKLAITALERAVEKYVQAGFLVKAIAACKMILQIDPANSAIKERLFALDAERTSVDGPRGVRAPTALDGEPSLPELRPTRSPQPKPAAPSAAKPAPAQPAAEPKPGVEPKPGARPQQAAAPQPPPAQPARSEADEARHALLQREAARHAALQSEAIRRAAAEPLTEAIPLSEPAEPAAPDVSKMSQQAPVGPRTRRPARRTIPPGAPLDQVNLGEVVPGAHQEVNERGEDSGVFEIPINVDDADVLEIDDSDVLELEEPRQLGENATRALRETPLLSSLGPEAMQRLIVEVELVDLSPGQVLYRQGDMGDALYVVAYGSVSMVSEGPPRVELSNLGEGEFFGEIALVTNQARNATIEAHPESGAQLLAIARDVIGNLVDEEPAVLQALLRFLRNRLVDSLVHNSPLFAPFAGDERRALANRFRFLEVKPGALVLQQGVKASGFFILLAGRLEAVYRDAKRERVLGTLDSGDMFGELSLLSNVPAEVTVRATAKSFVLELPAKTFREIIMTHPQVLMVVSDLAETRRQELDRILSGGGEYPPGNVRLM